MIHEGGLGSPHEVKRYMGPHCVSSALGWSIRRVCNCRPPHGLEQGPVSCQSVTRHSPGGGGSGCGAEGAEAAHAWRLHGCIIIVGWQSGYPGRGKRAFICQPPPHSRVHGLQSLGQGAYWHPTGQGGGAHCAIWMRGTPGGGHGAPCVGKMTWRVRYLEDTEEAPAQGRHSDQGDQALI